MPTTCGNCTFVEHALVCLDFSKSKAAPVPTAVKTITSEARSVGLVKFMNLGFTSEMNMSLACDGEPEFPEAWQGVAGVRLGVTAQAEHPIAAAMHQCTRRAPARGQVAGHTLAYTASRIHPPAPRNLANDAFSYKWSFWFFAMLSKKTRYLSTRIPTPRSCCQRSMKRLQILIWCKAPRCKCSLTFASPRGEAAGVSSRPVPRCNTQPQGHKGR